jgi:hypothetical protein
MSDLHTLRINLSALRDKIEDLEVLKKHQLSDVRHLEREESLYLLKRGVLQREDVSDSPPGSTLSIRRSEMLAVDSVLSTIRQQLNVKRMRIRTLSSKLSDAQEDVLILETTLADLEKDIRDAHVAAESLEDSLRASNRAFKKVKKDICSSAEQNMTSQEPKKMTSQEQKKMTSQEPKKMTSQEPKKMTSLLMSQEQNMAERDDDIRDFMDSSPSRYAVRLSSWNTSSSVPRSVPPPPSTPKDQVKEVAYSWGKLKLEHPERVPEVKKPEPVRIHRGGGKVGGGNERPAGGKGCFRFGYSNEPEAPAHVCGSNCYKDLEHGINDIPDDFREWLRRRSEYARDQQTDEENQCDANFLNGIWKVTMKKDLDPWCSEAGLDFYHHACNRKRFLMLGNREECAEYYDAIAQYLLKCKDKLKYAQDPYDSDATVVVSPVKSPVKSAVKSAFKSPFPNPPALTSPPRIKRVTEVPDEDDEDDVCRRCSKKKRMNDDDPSFKIDPPVKPLFLHDVEGMVKEWVTKNHPRLPQFHWLKEAQDWLFGVHQTIYIENLKKMNTEYEKYKLFSDIEKYLREQVFSKVYNGNEVFYGSFKDETYVKK